MIRYNKYIPEMNLPIVIKTTNGYIREAIDDGFFLGGYRLTDCTHPMQNCFLSSSDIEEWEYKDKRYMEECRFIENTYARRKEADKIIDGVKITWLDKLKWKLNIF